VTEPVSRRRALGLAGALAGGAAIGGSAIGGAVWRSSADATAGPSAGATPPPTPVAFHGAHQAGVTVGPQAHLMAVGVSVAADGPDALRALLGRWTVAAERLTRGHQVAERSPSSRLPPVDSGEADDRDLSRLTITLAVGEGLFGSPATDRFALAARRPPALAAVPPTAGEVLRPHLAPADLLLLVAGDDLQVVAHAVRNLISAGAGQVGWRWTLSGFGPPAGASATVGQPSTHRNLLGFREGTANPHPEQAGFDEGLWVQPSDGPAWMAGGTYVVLRHMVLDLAAWDALNLLDRERVIGRHRRSGAPLGEREELATLDLAAEGPDGRPVTDPRAHVAVARAATTGAPMLRRSYNTAAAGPDDPSGEAGQLFLAFARDPATQVTPVLQALAEHDLLSGYTTTVAAGTYAVLPGTTAGGSWADALLSSTP
jgi:deferrochelatase/peroxidase EfeB